MVPAFLAFLSSLATCAGRWDTHEHFLLPCRPRASALAVFSSWGEPGDGPGSSTDHPGAAWTPPARDIPKSLGSEDGEDRFQGWQQQRWQSWNLAPLGKNPSLLLVQNVTSQGWGQQKPPRTACFPSGLPSKAGAEQQHLSYLLR